jgi:hypothetical protein
MLVATLESDNLAVSNLIMCNLLYPAPEYHIKQRLLCELFIIIHAISINNSSTNKLNLNLIQGLHNGL